MEERRNEWRLIDDVAIVRDLQGLMSGPVKLVEKTAKLEERLEKSAMKSIPEQIRAKFRKALNKFRDQYGDGLSILHFIMQNYYENIGEIWFNIGARGSGKTTLNGWLLYHVYSLFLDEKDYDSREEYEKAVWDAALQHIVYSSLDFDRIKNDYASAGVRAPLIVIDDASLTLNARRHWDREQREFVRTLGTIREYVNTIIITDPSYHSIDSAIRREASGAIMCFTRRSLGIQSYIWNMTNLEKILREKELVGKRVAFFYYIDKSFNIFKSFQPFNTVIPIHTGSSPITYPELPFFVKEKLDQLKKAVTEAIDEGRQELLARQPHFFNDAYKSLLPYEVQILKLIYEMVTKIDPHGDRMVKFQTQDVASYIYESKKAGLKEWADNVTALNHVLKRLVAKKLIHPATIGYYLTPYGRGFVEKLQSIENQEPGEF